MQVFQTGTGNNQSNHFPHIPEKVTWSLNTIINGKSQTLLSDFFEGRGGCTQAKLIWPWLRAVVPDSYIRFRFLRCGALPTSWHCGFIVRSKDHLGSALC